MFGPAGVADGGVAGVVAAVILGDVGFSGVERPMGGGVGEVKEEGWRGGELGVFVEEADGLIGEGVGVVEFFGLIFGIVGLADLGIIAD